MICQVCKSKYATRTEKIKTELGITADVNLCDVCAVRFINNSKPIETPGNYWKPVKNKSSVICPTCKTDIDDFLETGYLGCSDCYQAFNGDIERAILGIHKGYKHTGKVPERESSKEIVKNKIKELAQKMGEAVKAEDFEVAGVLQKQIKSLRGEI